MYALEATDSDPADWVTLVAQLRTAHIELLKTMAELAMEHGCSAFELERVLHGVARIRSKMAAAIEAECRILFPLLNRSRRCHEIKEAAEETCRL